MKLSSREKIRYSDLVTDCFVLRASDFRFCQSEIHAASSCDWSRRVKQDTKMMSKIESIILGMFFGFLPVLLCVAAAGFVNVIFLEEKGIAYWALGGLVVGLIIDIIFVKSWVKKAYQMNNKILAVIYLFYSVLALGMGMGVPIFNFALGILAGIYIARKMHFLGYDEEKRNQAVKKHGIILRGSYGVDMLLDNAVGYSWSDDRLQI